MTNVKDKREIINQQSQQNIIKFYKAILPGVTLQPNPITPSQLLVQDANNMDNLNIFFDSATRFSNLSGFGDITIASDFPKITFQNNTTHTDGVMTFDGTKFNLTNLAGTGSITITDALPYLRFIDTTSGQEGKFIWDGNKLTWDKTFQMNTLRLFNGTDTGNLSVTSQGIVSDKAMQLYDKMSLFDGTTLANIRYNNDEIQIDKGIDVTGNIGISNGVDSGSLSITSTGIISDKALQVRDKLQMSDGTTLANMSYTGGDFQFDKDIKVTGTVQISNGTTQAQLSYDGTKLICDKQLQGYYKLMLTNSSTGSITYDGTKFMSDKPIQSYQYLRLLNGTSANITYDATRVVFDKPTRTNQMEIVNGSYVATITNPSWGLELQFNAPFRVNGNSYFAFYDSSKSPTVAQMSWDGTNFSTNVPVSTPGLKASGTTGTTLLSLTNTSTSQTCGFTMDLSGNVLLNKNLQVQNLVYLSPACSVYYNGAQVQISQPTRIAAPMDGNCLTLYNTGYALSANFSLPNTGGVKLDQHFMVPNLGTTNYPDLNTTIALLTSRITTLELNQKCVPIGAIIPALWRDDFISIGTQIYIKCNGQGYNTSLFPELYAFLGVANVPDMRNRGLYYDQSQFPGALVGSSSVSFTLDSSNLPYHNHEIFYNTSSIKGGIWGGSGADNGNYGRAEGGNGTYAKTAFSGGGQAKTLTLPTPPSFCVFYYVCGK